MFVGILCYEEREFFLCQYYPQTVVYNSACNSLRRYTAATWYTYSMAAVNANGMTSLLPTFTDKIHRRQLNKRFFFDWVVGTK